MSSVTPYYDLAINNKIKEMHTTTVTNQTQSRT
jgi:hypothetical protein